MTTFLLCTFAASQLFLGNVFLPSEKLHVSSGYVWNSILWQNLTKIHLLLIGVANVLVEACWINKIKPKCTFSAILLSGMNVKMPNKSLFYSSILECSSKVFRNRNIYIKYAYFQSHYMYPFRLLIALWFLKDKGCAIRICFVDYRMDAFSVFDDPLTRHKKTPNLKRHSVSDCPMPCLYTILTGN